MIIIFAEKNKYIRLGISILLVAIIFLGIKNINNVVSASKIDNSPYYLALVIDDFGNGQDGTEEFLNLSVPFTAAIMPSMPDTTQESKVLSEKGNDIILHLPMEAINGKKSWLGKNAITVDLSNEQIISTLEDSISQVHNIVGINNHMGSKATADERIMELIIKTAKEKNLLFVDSKTTPKSKSKIMGEKYGVTVLPRDVFLDSTDDIKEIEKNLIKAGNIAVKTGYCIAIGHVGNAGGKITANAIENKKQELLEKGIEFITITELAEIIKIKNLF